MNYAVEMCQNHITNEKESEHKVYRNGEEMADSWGIKPFKKATSLNQQSAFLRVN